MRIPTATYRLQFNHAFGFRAAKAIVPYLAELGISDIYASPIFKAKTGSLHGYDLVDPNQLNPELGTPADFEELLAEVQAHGMGWLQDIVPNHMAFDSENGLLMDVFENGRASPYFNCFDINWTLNEEDKPEVLAPFLGKFYGDALESGEISISFGANGLTGNYYDFKFPLTVESYAGVFTRNISVLRKKLGDSHSDFIRYLGALYVLQGLASCEPEHQRHERVNVIKKTLWDLYRGNATIAAFIDANVAEFNGKSDDPSSFNLLDDLLAEQVFRLSFWKVAYEEINYRRFFSINNLISMKMEDAQVFERLHSLILRMVSDKKFSGLRVDHIDGLYDPASYLRELKSRTQTAYLIVEKILDLGEELPGNWPIEGTTGYDFLNYVNGLFCRVDHESEFDKIYANFAGRIAPYNSLVYEKKRLIIETHMGGDIDNLARLLKRLSGRDRYGRDITLYGLRRALVEILAQFPVYRTYVNNEQLSERDRSHIVEAVRRAAAHSPGLLNEINFLNKFFLLDFGPSMTDDEKRQRVRFVMRFQQFTGPLMAKGFEDTLLYVYNRLISLNEVGGSPDSFGISVADFHRFNQFRASIWPNSLNATSTHDTKRGEDVRARINVISEIPGEWESALKRLTRLNRGKRKLLASEPVPDSNDEYFFYQTLLGTFPSGHDNDQQYIERLKEYTVKVVREAKVHTAWLKPDIDYENAFLAFLEKVLVDRRHNAFLKEFTHLQRKTAHFGVFNSLSQLLIKATAPGIPDFYQGTELWDLSLVDPDNRRPVDFRLRMQLFADIQRKAQADLPGLIRELLDSKEDGRIKFFLTHRLLIARKHRRQLFQEGTYSPLATGGEFRENIVCFARVYNKQWAATVAPRFLTSIIGDGENPLGEIWKDTVIRLSDESPKRWRNAITDELVTRDAIMSVGKALEHFPVALLVSEDQ